MASRKPIVIALFDVDGTLTAPRKAVTFKMLQFMKELGKVVTTGVVVGSDRVKISEQLGQTVITDYDYVFARMALWLRWKLGGKLIGTQSLKMLLGEENLKWNDQCITHWRNCRLEEPDEFEKYDKVENIRSKLVSILREEFGHLNLTFSIGGQISFDVFPQGWDKTNCLRYLYEFSEIHFFGGKTYKLQALRTQQLSV